MGYCEAGHEVIVRPTLRINVSTMLLISGQPPAPPPKQVRRKVMVTRIYMLGSKVNTKILTELGEDELSTTVKPYHAPRRGSAFASPS